MDSEMEFNISDKFSNTQIITVDGQNGDYTELWQSHPKFAGVEMKKIIDSKVSGNKLTSLLIKVQPKCELLEHIHDGQWEMHEVIEGSGKFTLGEKLYDYKQGSVAIIPLGIKHSVTAGDKGLRLLAKFF